MIFNHQQLAAIEAKEKDCVVCAGPGSGKSAVIIQRILHLHHCKEWVNLCNIVAITFTISAGKVLKDRLAEHGVQVGYVGTLHSWLLREIGKHRKSLGFKSQLTVLSEEDATALYHRLADDLKYSGTLEDLKAALTAPPVSSLMKSRPMVTAMAIRQYLKDRSQLTFDTILSYGQLIAGKLTPEVLFYDEAQDMNQAQANIVQDCGARQRFIVGDPRQAIFAFNGGSPEHMLKFAETFKVYSLSNNYRCPIKVCALANELASSMEGPKDPYFGWSTFATKHEEGEVVYQGFDNDFQQDERVDSWLRYLLQKGVKDIAILCRLNQQADRWKEKLTWAGFPVARTVTVIPSDWKKALAFARAAAAPDNPYAMAEWIRSKNGDTQAEAFLAVELSGCGFSKLKHEEILSRNINELSEESMAILNSYGPDPQERLMGALSHQFERTEQAGIHVLTMHKAKGQQWKAVVLTDFSDNIIPAGRDVAEDLRLAFVAITRSSHYLFLSSVGKPSRFLSLMGLTSSEETA